MVYLKQYEILINRAKDDYNTAKLVYDNIEDINIDVALFHLQQAVEKSLKALLIFNEIEFPRTHKLDILLDILSENNLKLEISKELIVLNEYAVEARYDYIGEVFDDFAIVAIKVQELVENIEKMVGLR